MSYIERDQARFREVRGCGDHRIQQIDAVRLPVLTTPFAGAFGNGRVDAMISSGSSAPRIALPSSRLAAPANNSATVTADTEVGKAAVLSIQSRAGA
jgi:hypothetical protein